MAIVTSGETIPTGDESTLYLGVAVVAEAVGDGDAVTVVFELDYQCMDYKNTITVDAVTMTEGDTATPEDYIIDYTGGTGGVSEITFTVAPGAAEAIVATYTRAVEFAAGSACDIDYSHDKMSRIKYGAKTKLTKIGAGEVTAKITDVWVDADKVRRFVGSVADASPVSAKTKFVWSGASPGVVPWVLIRTVRSSAVVLLTYLKNLQLESGSFKPNVADFFEDEMSLSAEDVEMVYTTPT